MATGFRWRRAGEGEAANTISHVAFDRGALDIQRLAADTGYAPRFTMAQAAADALAWDKAAWDELPLDAAV